MVKHILLADFAKNEKMEKSQIFAESHRLTPLVILVTQVTFVIFSP